MTLTVSPNLNDVFTAVRAFILTIVPAGTKVIRGPVNRAAQPAADHVVITPTYRKQLRTNIATDVDPFPDPGDGTTALEQGVQVNIQTDFYGGVSGDWAAMFSTVWRSEEGVTALAPACAPLYADEGRMVPLVTGEEQYLERWMVPAVLQYNPVTTVLQQFADAASANIINVDERYPP